MLSILCTMRRLFAFSLVLVLILVKIVLNDNFVDAYYNSEVVDLIRKCTRNVIKWKCFRNESLNMIEGVVNKDRITISEEIDLVKKIQDNNEETGSIDGEIQRKLYAGRYDNKSWAESVVDILKHVFETHVLQVNLNSFDVKAPNEARHRRRQQMMLPLMMMGVVTLGMFMVPSFQFLAALAGKAFLMAKLALVIASINGFRKVASGGVNYGLYHAPDPGYYGRGDNLGPRKV